jgi:hypothetical protein
VELSGELRHVLAVLLALGGGWAGLHGIRLLIRALRHPGDDAASLWLIRGMRGTVVAVGAGALAFGVFYGQLWLIVFGAIFLAEELYETGVVALILRAGRRRETSAR